MNSKIEVSNKFLLFQDLSLEEVSVLSERLGSMEILENDIVFSDGDAGEFVCFIVDGELEVLKESIDGKVNSLATLNNGQAFGEMALVDGLPRSATIRAISQSTLRVLSRKDFDALLNQAPQIGIKILKHLARGLSLNLRKTSKKLADCMEIDSIAISEKEGS